MQTKAFTLTWLLVLALITAKSGAREVVDELPPQKRVTNCLQLLNDTYSLFELPNDLDWQRTQKLLNFLRTKPYKVFTAGQSLGLILLNAQSFQNIIDGNFYASVGTPQPTKEEIASARLSVKEFFVHFLNSLPTVDRRTPIPFPLDSILRFRQQTYKRQYRGTFATSNRRVLEYPGRAKFLNDLTYALALIVKPEYARGFVTELSRAQVEYLVRIDDKGALINSTFDEVFPVDTVSQRRQHAAYLVLNHFSNIFP